MAGKNQRRNPKHVHCFVTVAFPNGNTLTVNVPAKVYSLAENGKKALVLEYDEQEGRKDKLPFEIAVL